MRSLLISLIILLYTTAAYGQGKYNFHLGLSYNDRFEKTDGIANINVKTTVYNVGFGADINSGIYLGLKYYQYGEAWGRSRDEDKKVTSPGLSLGYMSPSGFTIIASYLWDPKKVYPYSTGGQVTYSGGNGLLVDIAYLIKSGNYAIGPQISQATIKYEKIKGPTGTRSVQGSTRDIHLFPYLVLYVFI